MVGDGNMMGDHAKLHPCMLVARSSGRIGRAVRMRADIFSVGLDMSTVKQLKSGKGVLVADS
eukprot:2803123-Pyramimonas_sp.AAC.1